MERPAARPNLPALTSLRFFAAYVVVAFHYNPDRFVHLPAVFRNWLETGYEAVTFFFVLSGFIMSYIYSDFDAAVARRADWRTFFVARFGRLAPAYYLSLLVALPFVVVDALIWDEPLMQLVTEAALVLTFLQSWSPEAALAWNPPCWSISVEWGLYAAFPALAVLSRRLSGRRMLLIAFFIVTLVATFRLRVMMPLLEEPEWHNFAQYFPLFHLPAFYFGMALGRIHLTGPRPPPQLAAFFCGTSILALMINYSGLVHLPALFASDAILVLLFGMLIIGAAQPGHVTHRLLSLSPLIFLGEISYSIYALHEPIALWWEWLRLDDYAASRLPPSIEFLSYFTVVLAASTLSYFWIETPLRRAIRRRGERA